MKVVMNVEKWQVFLVSGILLVFIGMFFVSAFGGYNPEVMGHSSGEIAGGILFIKGNSTGANFSSFVVTKVFSNSLLENNPTISNVTIEEAGEYIITSVSNRCRSGSSYLGALVLVNGDPIYGRDGLSVECGSVSASVALILEEGDIVSGQCRVNTGDQGTCSFMLVRVG